MSNNREFAEFQIDVPWGHISGKWWGPKGKQAILALHGFQDNAGTFDELINLLPANLSILAIDFPGHGQSSHLPPGVAYYRYWDGLIHIRRIVQHFNWKKITILGHSMGAGIGFLYASCYPDDVEALISLDAAGPRIDPPSTHAQSTHDYVEKFLKYEKLNENNMPSYTYNEMIDLVEDAYAGSMTREACKIMMKRGMRRNPQNPNLYHFTRDVRLKVSNIGLPSIDVVLEFAKKVKCRYLNVKAVPGGKSAEKEKIYNEIMEVLRESSRDFRCVEVEGAHHVHLNNASLVAPHVMAFLAL
ncbi:unnamed protein product [Bemisia tabaci]|uniref:AB hydrolase-1 domain-containing protein n=1 Tax=Bemisia tabaci TaxID=7038 RepID=A0A9P0A4S2_BEMTA|nr:unnamed protein product [Bemisia tabaci]